MGFSLLFCFSRFLIPFAGNSTQWIFAHEDQNVFSLLGSWEVDDVKQ